MKLLKSKKRQDNKRRNQLIIRSLLQKGFQEYYYSSQSDKILIDYLAVKVVDILPEETNLVQKSQYSAEDILDMIDNKTYRIKKSSRIKIKINQVISNHKKGFGNTVLIIASIIFYYVLWIVMKAIS